jgi:hypothetical protein
MKGWLGEGKKKKEKKKVATENAPSHHQGISLSIIMTEAFRGVPRSFQ